MKKTILAHKIRLSPSKEDIIYFNKACGTARFAYNWALDRWNILHKQNVKTSAGELSKELNAIKRKEFPWMLDVAKNAVQYAVKAVGTSFERFFKKVSKHPKFHKKGVKDSFTLDACQFKLKENKIHIPKLGWVKMTEHLRFEGKLLFATISRRADKWFVSISVELADLSHLNHNFNTKQEDTTVGVDLGIKTLVTLSNGESFHKSDKINNTISKVKRLQRQLHRRVKGSKNREKTKTKLALQYYRSVCQKLDVIHKITSYLTQNFSIVAIEDLNVKGMLKNRKLSRAIHELGFYEFRRQLAYKTQLRGGLLFVADRFLPSSKLCSNCGFKNDALELKDREWVCLSCGSQHDRDLNASINLRNLAVSSTVSACGVGSSG